MEVPTDAVAASNRPVPKESKSQENEAADFDDGMYEALRPSIPRLLKCFVHELFLTKEVCFCALGRDNCAFNAPSTVAIIVIDHISFICTLNSKEYNTMQTR